MLQGEVRRRPTDCTGGYVYIVGCTSRLVVIDECDVLCKAGRVVDSISISNAASARSRRADRGRTRRLADLDCGAGVKSAQREVL